MSVQQMLIPVSPPKCLLVALLATLCTSVCSAAVHPFHTSMTEMEFNPETKRIEVAVKLYSVDCETALGRLNKKAIDLDNEAVRDRLLAKYVESRFLFETKTKSPANKNTESDDKKTRQRFNYIGSEISGAHVWAYFELIPSLGQREFVLRNTLLLEVQEEQVNVVRFRESKGQQTHVFNAKNKSRKVRLRK